MQTSGEPKKLKSVYEILIKIWRCTRKQQRKNSAFTLIVIAMTSAAEFGYIYSLYPAIQSILSTPDGFNKNTQGVYKIISGNQHSPTDSLILAILALGLLTVLRGLSAKMINKSISQVSSCITSRAYAGIFSSQYEELISKDKSDIAALLTTRCNLLQHLIQQYFNMASSVSSIAIVTIGLLTVTPYITIGIVAATLCSYFLVHKFINPKIYKNGEKLLEYLRQQQFYVAESLHSIRDMAMNKRSDYYIDHYSTNEKLLRNTEESSAFYLALPKILIEAIFMLFILLSLLRAVKGGLDTQLIAAVGMLILAVQRLLPAAQQAYTSYSTISHNIFPLKELVSYANITRRPNPGSPTGDTCICGPKFLSLELRNISFAYKASGLRVLTNVNIKIDNRSLVGIIGKSGAGKTTIVDICCGLLYPSSGDIILNSNILKSEEEHRVMLSSIMTYSPQSPVIINGTLLENITYLEHSRVAPWQREKAFTSIVKCGLKLGENKESMLRYSIKEEGANLSGGQRQKIAIARALYHSKGILILDEPTNALDYKSKEQILELIKDLSNSSSILMISHDKDAIAMCDRTYELKEGETIFSYKSFN